MCVITKNCVVSCLKWQPLEYLFYNGNFSGVMTKYVDVTLKNMPSEEFVSVSDKEKYSSSQKDIFTDILILFLMC